MRCIRRAVLLSQGSFNCAKNRVATSGEFFGLPSDKSVILEDRMRYLVGVSNASTDVDCVTSPNLLGPGVDQ